ncbi:MAG: hypothetical protein R3B93_05875 [Bacteroidia bacterium]
MKLPNPITRVTVIQAISRKKGKIANFGHTICIDTYAYGGKWLTCLNVETNYYIKANNLGEVEIGKLS